jgi:EmrB/QacA subfamily drug resistance transporter
LLPGPAIIEVPAQAEAAQHPRPEPVRLADFLQLFSAVMLPMFMAAVDQTLLATALPTIAHELGGWRDASWIAVGYLLAATIMVPFYGRLGDRIGRRRVLLGALLIFTAGSLAGGFAGTMTGLIAARFVQGLGGGGLMVTAQALIGELVPPRERAKFQGWFAALFSTASVGGPLLGSYVTEWAGWRWLFWANLPLAVLAAWRIGRLPDLRSAAPEPAREPPDVLGMLLFAAASTAALVWVGFVGDRFDWLSPMSLALIAGSLIGLVALVLVERRRAEPFLPIEMLRKPGVPWLTATVVCFASCLFAMVFYLPVYLQLGLGSSVTHSGMMILPLTIGMVTGSTLTGRIVAATGRPQPLPIAGLCLSSLALGLLALLPPDASWIVPLGLACGMGFGTVMPTTQVTLQEMAGRQRLGAATATASLSRSIGSVTGTAVFGALLFASFGSNDLRGAVATHDPTLVVAAFHRVFLACAMLSALGAFCATRVRPIVLR